MTETKTPLLTAPKRSRSFDAAKLRLQSILSQAKCYQLTSESITQKWIALKAEFNLPDYRWAWLDGYWAAVRDQWSYHDLVYCYVFDGKPVEANWAMLTDAQRESFTKAASCPNGHFWRNADGSPGAPYFVA